MKTIQDVQIWSNGIIKIANILNAYAIKVNLNNSAVFNYQLFYANENNIIDEIIIDGLIQMPTEQYLQWDQDEFAWDFVASALNLVITGDYVAPQPPIVEESVIEAGPIEQAPVEESTEESPSNSL